MRKSRVQEVKWFGEGHRLYKIKMGSKLSLVKLLNLGPSPLHSQPAEEMDRELCHHPRQRRSYAFIDSVGICRAPVPIRHRTCKDEHCHTQSNLHAKNLLLSKLRQQRCKQTWNIPSTKEGGQCPEPRSRANG